MKLNTCFLGLLILVSLARGESIDLSFNEWSQWLRAYAKVHGPVTLVNYKKAQNNRKSLDSLMGQFEGVSKSTFDSWSEKDRLAFLINAYNVFTIKLIVDNYPLKSIKDLGSLFKSPWKKKFFKLFGEDETLDGIEHERIRKKFKEPRIHFAVVCASKGCPALKGEAYVGSRLNDQLEESLRNFLKDETRNRWDEKNNVLYLSKIFKWYADDFKNAAGSELAFLAPRMAGSEAQEKLFNQAKIEFLDYDWSLNETQE